MSVVGVARHHMSAAIEGNFVCHAVRFDKRHVDVERLGEIAPGVMGAEMWSADP